MTFRKNLLAPFFTLTLFCSTPVFADTTVPSWAIVKESSSLGFEAVQMGAPFEGHFKAFGGQINFDPTNLSASKVDIAINMDSADANSTDRNKYLPMPDWFNTAQFPDAHFVTSSITKGLDKNQYVAKGNLTIRDVTLPITLPFTLDISRADSGEEVAVMKSETSINRLDYKVGQGEWSDTKTVENKVKISISLMAKRQIKAAAP